MESRTLTSAPLALVVGAASAVLPAVGAAAEPAHHLYVGPGDDTAVGSGRAPFATIQHTPDVAPTGTTVHLTGNVGPAAPCGSR